MGIEFIDSDLDELDDDSFTEPISNRVPFDAIELGTKAVKLCVVNDDETVFLTVKGEPEIWTEEVKCALRKVIPQLLTGTQKKMIVDMSKVKFLEGGTFALFYEFADSITQETGAITKGGKKMLIYNPSEAVRKMIWFQMYCVLSTDIDGCYEFFSEQQKEHFTVLGMAGDPRLQEQSGNEKTIEEATLARMAAEISRVEFGRVNEGERRPTSYIPATSRKL